MTPRPGIGAAGLVLAAALLVGCAPDPAPTPSATGFADEDAAFAAAEATYRAYVDALNQVDLSNPATFEEVYQWTTGDLNASDREGLSYYHAEGYTISGETSITEIALNSVASDFSTITIDLCLDVSEINIVDANGSSQIDADRVEIQTVRATLITSTSTTGLQIESLAARGDGPTC
ncbi:MAG: hypothetical protein QM604_12495 [Microbacterium sp.]